MNNLQQVFNKFSLINKDVLICLDNETFCFAKSPDINGGGSRPKNYISITSIMEKDDVIECLEEEGSAIINFKLSSKGSCKNINKILNSLISILVEYNFEPFIVTLLSNEVIISVVISDTDIGMNFSNSLCDDDNEDEEKNHKYETTDEEEKNNIEDKKVENNTDEECNDSIDGNTEEIESTEEDNYEENDEEDEEDEYNNEDNNEDKEDEEDNYEENDDKDEDKEDEEEDKEEYDDEEDPIKIEIRKINEEIKELNINKLKKDNYIDYLRRLNIKNIKGKNTKHCNKQDLCDYLFEKLEN